MNTQMHQENRDTDKGIAVFSWAQRGALIAAALTGLIAWTWMYAGQAANADTLWLTEAARRFLSGVKMADGYFETNPPLAVLAHVPHVLLHKATGAPLHFVFFFLTLFMLALSTAALWRIMRHWDFLDEACRMAMAYGFILSMTLLAMHSFGERDQMVAFALTPFVLAQITLTFRLPAPKGLLWAVFAVGACFILLKPHHGLIPAAMIGYRLWRERRLKTLIAPDVICLSAAVILYAGITWLLFPDYISVILPEVLKTYLPAGYDSGAVTGILMQYAPASGLFIILPLLAKDMDARTRYMAAFLAACALISLIPVIVQGRGYYYHLLPATAFLWMAAALWFTLYLRRQVSAFFALVFALILITCGAFLAWKGVPRYPTHEQYRELPLVKMAAECAAPPCKAMFFFSNLESGQMISHYAGAEYASRFGSLWFLPRLVVGADTDKDRKIYTDMMTQDLRNYRPDTIFVESFEMIRGDGPFDIPAYLAQDEAFAREWAKYAPFATLPYNMDEYLPDVVAAHEGPRTVQVYKRMADAAP